MLNKRLLSGTTLKKMSHASSRLDAAQGALLGAACGDAAGSVLEFGGPVSAARAAWSLGMPGGGRSDHLRSELPTRNLANFQLCDCQPHTTYAEIEWEEPGPCVAGCFNLGKGQFTDDTELALSLANGLLLHDGSSHSFPAGQVAQQYVRRAACSIRLLHSCPLTQPCSSAWVG